MNVPISETIRLRRKSVNVAVQVNIPSTESVQQPRESIGVQTEIRDENIWCICRQQDDGRNMILCENDQCMIQWFHFDCIGIDVAPENDWYCQNCALIMNRL